MNEEEKATQKQIKKLYATVLSQYKTENEIEGGLAPDKAKAVIDEYKSESGIASFAELGKKEISVMIDEIENPPSEVKHVKQKDEGDTESEEVKQEVNPEEKKEKTEMERIAEEMQVAVRYATQIAIEEVQGKIEAQGLASFIQKLATTMFLANKRQKVKEEEVY